MAEKKVKTRIQQKHDIEANWIKATSFTPMAGEVIVYDAEAYTTDLTGTNRTTPITYERFKIGDGKTLVTALPFTTNPHNHDDRYYTESEINTKVEALETAIAAKAPISHASSAVTYGVSTDKQFGHAMASSATPKMDGIASVGSATSAFARGDHVHPTDTSRAASSHTHGNITNVGELGTASRIVVTDANKKITTGSIDPATIVLNSDTRLTNARTPLAHTHTVADINDFPDALPADGGNADTVDGKHAADFVTTSQKGVALGVAELGPDCKVPSYQLPSYVDDVIEYSAKASFPATGESGKIYIETSTSKTWRWSGTQYVEISSSIALGETSSTAYRGDRGKTAYDHSKTPHAPSDAEKNVQSDWSVTDTSSDAYIKNKPTIPTDTNTTYDLSAPADKTNGNVTIDLTAGGSGSGTDSVSIKGSGATSVTTDANGVINISSANNATTQTSSANSNEELRLLLSYGATDTTQTLGVKKSPKLTFIPGYGELLVGLPTPVYEEDVDGDGIVDDSWFDNTNAGTGKLVVSGDIVAGGGGDDFGIVPAQNNRSTIGRADLKWYTIYGSMIYGDTLYEGGEALSSRYVSRDHASTATTYGASSATNYGHAKASSTAPKAPAETASVGSETSSFARGDHVHQAQAVVTIYTWEADD